MEAHLTALVPVKAYHPDYLREAFASLLAQTSTRWRALVIHPAGLGPRLAREFAHVFADSRVQLVEERGRKLAGALNTGMRAAVTPFAAILLGDDLWAPEAVEVLSARIAASPEIDFFHTSRRIVDDAGAPLSSVHRARGEVRVEEFLARSPVKHLLCFRVEKALAIGGIDESLDSIGADDYDFPWSMMEAGARFQSVDECLYIYRDHRATFRLTTHVPLSVHLRETGRILRKHGADEATIASRLEAARRTYLRQCLYASAADAMVKRLTRLDPSRGWRERYT